MIEESPIEKILVIDFHTSVVARPTPGAKPENFPWVPLFEKQNSWGARC